jgi:hypothetical protein
LFLSHCRLARRGVEVENALLAGASEHERRRREAIVAGCVWCGIYSRVWS